MNIKKTAKIAGIAILALVVIIIIILISMGRYSSTRSECHSSAWDLANKKQITTFDRDYNFYYEACLHSKGIK